MGAISDETISDCSKRNAPPQPERVVRFIRQVIRNEKFYAGTDRRTHLRYPVTLPVKVTPLDDTQHPMGEPFIGVTRDISLSGACIYHLHDVQFRFLQLEFSNSADDQLTVILEVVRCREAGPFFEIAGQFIGYA